ncbi:Acetyl-coenzyme A synthetase [Acinetobacter ursingii]|nr:Acetyl-coenzyme A synthetase [Acinetobacter ursingii]
MNDIYPVPEEYKKTARTLEADYFERYQQSIEQPEEFWAAEAKRLDGSNPLHRSKIPVMTPTILRSNGSLMVS